MSYDLTRLYDNIRIRCPGLLDSIMLLELFNTVYEFCSDTNAYQQDVALTTQAGFNDYTLVPADTNNGPVRLIFIYDSAGLGVDGYMPVVPIVRLSVTPTGVTTYTCTVALAPNEQAGGVTAAPTMPDWFWDSYVDTIRDGVLGRLLTQPAKPYTNLQMGMVYLKTFSQGKNQAKTQTLHGNNYRGQNWRFPGGFA